jgi:AAA15 family ATPase/GTPase
MRIKSFSYSSDDWILQKIDLQEVNLLVGTNGTGKSKTLFWLNLLKRYISMGDISDPVECGIFKISWLTNSNKIIKYYLEISENSIQELVISNESLFLEDKVLLQRKNDGSCIVFSESKQDFDTFNPPLNELALLSRRDTRDYPYFETVIDWAKSSYELEFSSINKANETVHTESNYEDYPKLYSMLSNEHKKNILGNYNTIGFKISDIRDMSLGNSNHYLILSEEGLNTKIYQFDLSQGMSRTLCLLIYLEYLISKSKTATLLIDDLGEGLDYKRAIELGKMLFKLCEENNIQLIATSNDSFLMEVVNIDYWNVLTRNGKTVTALNKFNRPELFRKFKFTGLSNFDFFSSDYIDSHL